VGAFRFQRLIPPYTQRQVGGWLLVAIVVVILVMFAR
jgi:hypothetical protein